MRVIFSLFIIALCSACTIQAPAQPNDPSYAPVLNLPERPDAAVNGSLYRENVAMNLFADRRAARIGDIITVVLEERTTSSKSSAVEIIKNNQMLSPLNDAASLLGVTPSIGNFDVLDNNIQNDRTFIGESDADQSNRLSGNISVTVVDIHPNGTLVVRGEKWIKLNRGNEYIRISGLVRSDDVNPDNTVMSTKLANARIEYSGIGELADIQKMGWLSRFFSSPMWPF